MEVTILKLWWFAKFGEGSSLIWIMSYLKWGFQRIHVRSGDASWKWATFQFFGAFLQRPRARCCILGLTGCQEVLYSMIPEVETMVSSQASLQWPKPVGLVGTVSGCVEVRRLLGMTGLTTLETHISMMYPRNKENRISLNLGKVYSYQQKNILVFSIILGTLSTF